MAVLTSDARMLVLLRWVRHISAFLRAAAEKALGPLLHTAARLPVPDEGGQRQHVPRTEFHIWTFS